MQKRPVSKAIYEQAKPEDDQKQRGAQRPGTFQEVQFAVEKHRSTETAIFLVVQ
jgi:hypothetical protein